jgi:hypothetical protein
MVGRRRRIESSRNAAGEQTYKIEMCQATLRPNVASSHAQGLQDSERPEIGSLPNGCRMAFYHLFA